MNANRFTGIFQTASQEGLIFAGQALILALFPTH